MRNVLVSIWPVNTMDVTANLPLDEKLSLFAANLKFAMANMGTAAARMRIAEPLFVFVAPEYLFIKSMLLSHGQPPQADLYSAGERDQILAGLRAIGKSQGTKHMLLIPGTILWKKARKTPIVQMGHNRTWDGFNIAPVIVGGDLKQVYTKRFDDGLCREKTTDVHFVRGSDSPLFKINGLRCGLEVCGDFIEQNLANESQGKSLDLEFYISATNPHAFESQSIAAIPVKNGGYFIHCDANGVSDHNGVWVVNRNRGSHGLMVNPCSNERLYDPWEGTPLGKDLAGLNVASSMALKTTEEIATQFPRPPALGGNGGNGAPKRDHRRRMSFDGASGRTNLPAPAPPAVPPDLKFQLVGLRPTQALSPGNAYQATMAVQLTDRAAAHAPVPNRAVRFVTDHGAMAPGTVFTDNRGLARAVLSANAAQKSTVSAMCLGATVRSSIELVQLGSGNVSLLGRLHGTPYGEIPCWHLAMP